jgi:hypothetical protein
MVRVTEARPCPICNKADWCLISPDGTAAICPRVKSEVRAGKAGFLHRLAESVAPPPASYSRTGLARDWDSIARDAARSLTPALADKLAAELCLPGEALRHLPLIGHGTSSRTGPYFTFPEADADEKIVGVTRRFADGSKKMMFGSKHGLTFPAGWRARPGPLFVPEGATDTLTMSFAGLRAVGRPFNSGGTDDLVALAATLPPDDHLILLGENDQKSDGEWPGRDGVERVARGVTEKSHRSVSIAFPPPGAKDVRDWLSSPARPGTSWAERGRELLEYLLKNTVAISSAKGPNDAPAAAGPNDAPENPHRLAAGFLTTINPAGEPLRLRFWRGDFVKWNGSAYSPVSDDDLKARVTSWVRDEFVRVNELDLVAWGADGSHRKGSPPKVRPVSPTRWTGPKGRNMQTSIRCGTRT